MNSDYRRIPVILKRYSFESKMAICQLQSRRLMKFNRLELFKDSSICYPWELDIFALYSILVDKEYKHDSFKEINDRHFVSVKQTRTCP